MAARYYDPFLRMYRLPDGRYVAETSADAWWLAGEKPGERKGGKGRKRAESCTGCGAPGHLWKTCEYCGR